MSFATPAKDKKWELLHSLWIGWTFTLGFFSWVAFVYIALRTRHTRWLLWALFYATPLILFIVPVQSSSASWDNLTLSTTMVLGVVSIIHAFLVRKEYLTRLELLQRARSNVSVTSRGRKWELLHSLWMVWTFAWGLFSWVAFLYIGLRARHARWILWSILYFTIFVVYVIVWAVTGAQSTPTQTMTGPLLVVGIVSIVHAFHVRNDYLVRLENRMPEAAADDMSTRRRLEEEYGLPTGDSPSNGSSEHPDTIGSSGTDAPPEEQSTAEGTTLAPPATTPPLAPVETNAGSDSKTGGSPKTISISDSYPLPIAHSWSLLAGLWDPRDRYREQLRHAENMLAFLGSVSLALLEKQDLKVKELQRLWSGGITLGGWKWIIQRNARALQEYKDNPLASAIYPHSAVW